MNKKKIERNEKQEMLKKIYEELVSIRKALQAIQSSLESTSEETTLNLKVANGDANDLIKEHIKEIKMKSSTS